MHNFASKLRIACLIFAVTVGAGGLTTARTAAQDPPQRPPMTEEERRRIAQRLLEELRGTQAQPPTPVQQQEPGARPPVPSIVQRAPLSSEQIQLSFDNQELYEFINTIAATLGITPIIIDPEVRGSVTIHSSAPMSKDDVLPLFNMILKNNNAALVMQGSIYQIVPISAALKRGLEIIEHLPPVPPAEPPVEKPAVGKPAVPTVPPAETPPAAAPPAAAQQPETPAPPVPQAEQRPVTRIPRLATHVIRVEFVPVRDLLEPLRLFMTDGGVIMPYERLNMLIVTDYTDSVSKVIEIIRLLDDSYLDPELVEVIEIKYNKSADVLEDLKKIFGAGGKDSPTGVYFISLDRLNAVLVMANSKRALAEVKRWIDRLDATVGRNIQTFVYTVENSTASNIAMILSMLFGGEGGPTQTGTQPGTQQGAAGGIQTPFGQAGGGMAGGFGGSPYQGGQYGGGFGQQMGGSFGGGFYGAGQQLGPRLSQGPSMSAQILRGGVFTGLQDTVRVVADDINNSLIIQASAADYAYILEIIRKMDVMPRQVLIDARIFEVDLTDALSFGIAADLQARAAGDRQTTAGVSGATGALTANTFAFVGDGREILLALDALRTKTNVRVLEAPSVLALDGTVAKIVVGGEVPYPGTSYVAAAGGATTSVQYRDTGVALIIMPRISASGTVTLEIAHELSSPGAQTPTGPTFNKASVQTTLAVKDGETVAIAGLIRESDARSRSGVPFLSEIPLVGALFGRSTRSAARTELLILITPHVIRTPERFQEMTRELQDSLRNVRKLVDSFQRNHLEDLEDARKQRMKEEERRMKKEDPPKVIPPK